jgi:hypothetical protein
MINAKTGLNFFKRGLNERKKIVGSTCNEYFSVPGTDSILDNLYREQDEIS